MYDLFQLSGSLAVWKMNYCSTDYERCARFKLSAEGKPVADHLLPNGSLLRLQPKAGG
jgi:hypothetical protein